MSLNPLEIVARRRRIQQAYKRLFESPDGQLVLEHLARTNFVFDKSTFVQGDPHQSALHEGQRRVVLSIMRYIATDSEKLLKMIEDNHA